MLEWQRICPNGKWENNYAGLTGRIQKNLKQAEKETDPEQKYAKLLLASAPILILQQKDKNTYLNTSLQLFAAPDGTNMSLAEKTNLLQRSLTQDLNSLAFLREKEGIAATQDLRLQRAEKFLEDKTQNKTIDFAQKITKLAFDSPETPPEKELLTRATATSGLQAVYKKLYPKKKLPKFLEKDYTSGPLCKLNSDYYLSFASCLELLRKDGKGDALSPEMLEKTTDHFDEYDLRALAGALQNIDEIMQQEKNPKEAMLQYSNIIMSGDSTAGRLAGLYGMKALYKNEFPEKEMPQDLQLQNLTPESLRKPDTLKKYYTFFSGKNNVPMGHTKINLR